MAREIWPSKRGSRTLRKGEFWAVDNVSLSVCPGEAVAVMGRNGAGKTSFLRMIAGLLKPDRGSITVSGTVNPVIELGQGLNPALTGLENAQLGLAWRGVAPQEIDGLAKIVADFSELGERFFDPVHNYSVGMRLRLAYAIATTVGGKLLLLDEVLAVGDIGFQRKCLQHMQRHLARGSSILLVSHDVYQVQTICKRGIVMEGGAIAHSGGIEDCIEFVFSTQIEDEDTLVSHQNNGYSLRISHLSTYGEYRDKQSSTSGPLNFEMEVEACESLRAIPLISIWTHDFGTCISIVMHDDALQFQPGSSIVAGKIPNLLLAPNTYVLRAALLDPETNHPVATHGFEASPTTFKVRGTSGLPALLKQNFGHLLSMEAEWSDVTTKSGSLSASFDMPTED